MATDFFNRQEQARRNTGRLLVLYTLAVAAVVAAVYALARVLSVQFVEMAGPFFDLELFLGVSFVTLLVIFGGVFLAWLEFRRGGSAVAESLGGRLLSRDTRDNQERMLLNVVEEMAIASGVPVPPVYLLDNESTINAFAAGWSIGDAAIGVTRGALDQLSRDELQGVMAHEFSHIFNGDMRLNLRLMGWLQGILGLAILGQILLRSLAFGSGRSRMRGSTSSNRDSGNAAIAIIAAGAGLWAIGSIGVLFARLIQAAVSRQREHLADASAVQFTRNPAGLCTALAKIAGIGGGGRIQHPRAMEAGHFFFANSFSASQLQSWFATHPPLLKRIQLLDPNFDVKAVSADGGRQSDSQRPQVSGVSGFGPGRGGPTSSGGTTRPSSGAASASASAFAGGLRPGAAPSSVQAHGLVDQVGQLDPEHLEAAQIWRQRLNPTLDEALHEGLGAECVLYGLVLVGDTKVRSQQIAILPTNVRDEVQTLEPILKSLARFDRLPVAELALTGLRQLSSAQHREFLKTLDQLILIDQKLDLFEMALRRMLTRRIAQWQGTSMNRLRSVKRQESYSRAQAIQVLISGVSYAGHPKSIEEARSSFEESWRTIPNLPPWNLLPLAKCQPEHLDVALDLLAEESAHRKKWILNAALNAVSSDGQLTPSEAEMMRAIGDSLDCPLPPWLTFPG